MPLLPWMDELSSYRQPTLSDLLSRELRMSLNDELSNPTMASQILTSRAWRSLLGDKSITINPIKDEFRINLDVQQFKPEELKVSIADGYLIVEGNHEERSDQHGFISRQFTRRCKIPDDVDENTIVSNLSSDGVLILKAPKKVAAGNQAREIPITHTNIPAVRQTIEKPPESLNNGSPF